MKERVSVKLILKVRKGCQMATLVSGWLILLSLEAQRVCTKMVLGKSGTGKNGTGENCSIKQVRKNIINKNGTSEKCE